MRPERKRRPPHVYEEGPSWPHRQRQPDRAEPERWAQPPELWETPYGVEPFPGATVLEDWALTEDDPASTARVLVRYAVIRVVQLSEAGLLRGIKLRTERRIATEHLALLPAGDWERMALRRVNDLCAETPPPSLPTAVLVAAEAAAKRGHTMGAFALYRVAHFLAMEQRDWDPAGRAARGIARLARLDEAPYSTRLWEWRATVLERRAARKRKEAEAVRTAESADPGPTGPTPAAPS